MKASSWGTRLRYQIFLKTKSIIKKVVPKTIWLQIKERLPRQLFRPDIEEVYIREWNKARVQAGPRYFPLNGFNVLGYLRAATGLGEAARSSLLALNAGHIPYATIDYAGDVPETQRIEEYLPSTFGEGFQFNANLIHINPPQLPFLWDRFSKEKLASLYNIGVWYWELQNFPVQWKYAFDFVDEVWVASLFVHDSVARLTQKPVRIIPPCIQTIYDQRLSRADFHLPTDKFLFLCAYDIFSVQSRKNPQGAFQAFKQAFPKGNSSVGLVIKINNSQESPREIQSLRRELSDYANVYFIEGLFEKKKFNSLVHLTDAYISLHRSEGFGLIPATAMSLGRPVVMTCWSGNVDFMTPENSCGVDFRLVQVGDHLGPYPPDQLWAEPNIEHAAFFMKKLVDDRCYYANISEHARTTIVENYSPENIGSQINLFLK